MKGLADLKPVLNVLSLGAARKEKEVSVPTPVHKILLPKDVVLCFLPSAVQIPMVYIWTYNSHSCLSSYFLPFLSRFGGRCSFVRSKSRLAENPFHLSILRYGVKYALHCSRSSLAIWHILDLYEDNPRSIVSSYIWAGASWLRSVGAVRHRQCQLQLQLRGFAWLPEDQCARAAPWQEIVS